MSYNTCDYFEDASFIGMVSEQRLTFDNWMSSKIDSYFVVDQKRPSVFSKQNVYALLGFGRKDADEKYDKSTMEEFTDYYNLDSLEVTIHFSTKGSVVIGRSLDLRG